MTISNTPEGVRLQQSLNDRVNTAVQQGIRLYGQGHQLTHTCEELAELLTSLLRLLRALADDPHGGASLVYTSKAIDEAADVILSMGTVRAVLGSDLVHLAVLRKLERYEKRLQAFELGFDLCCADHGRREPFQSVGGPEHRWNFSVPPVFRASFPEDSEGYFLRAFYDGYRGAARELYGPEWRSRDWSEAPAPVVDRSTAPVVRGCTEPSPYTPGTMCIHDANHQGLHLDTAPDGTKRYW